MSNRDSPIAHGIQAEQLLQNPAFNRAYDRLREQKISALETMQLTGTPETDAFAVATVRDLQALLNVRRTLLHELKAGDRAATKQVEDQKIKDKPLFDPTEPRTQSKANN